GNSRPTPLQASGRGTVHARTLVARAPTEELRAHAPYLIVLVDAEEGFRLMAHGDPALQIGDRVRARFAQLAGKKIPYFEKA
ncbi:MAG TPA: OB-fold domain-containing protein, partial [Burkholderiales bacterium]|nr:OB-fold domain-containing protein [Burkholderiales bacterium]